MAARDVLFVGVILLTLAVGFFLINFTMTTVVNDLVATPVINATNASVTAFETVKTVANRLDYILFAMFIGLVIGIVITAWFIGGHPIFMFAYFIIGTIAVVLAALFANVWYDISNMVVFGTTLTNFPITNHLLTNLPIYIAIVGFLGMVVMFAKPYVAGEQ